METQQEPVLEEFKPQLRNAPDSNTLNTPQKLSSSNVFINEISPAHAFSDSEDISSNFLSTDPNINEKHQYSTVASTPLNVVELSLNKSRLVSPPRTRSFRTNIGNGNGLMVDSASSPLEQELQREIRIKWLSETSTQLRSRIPNLESAKKSNHSRHVDAFSTSKDHSSFEREKVTSPEGRDDDAELLVLIRDPIALDDEWKRVDQHGENATDLGQILSWFSSRFPKNYNNGVSICKSFHLVASSIGRDTTHRIPRRAFKRLLMAIICINRSSNCISSIAPGSNG
jgi:hypothetical protein